MINLIATTTEASYIETPVAARRTTSLDTLFRSRNRVTQVETSSRYDSQHSGFACMSVLTEDACCAYCGLEFEV